MNINMTSNFAFTHLRHEEKYGWVLVFSNAVIHYRSGKKRRRCLCASFAFLILNNLVPRASCVFFDNGKMLVSPPFSKTQDYSSSFFSENVILTLAKVQNVALCQFF